MDETDGRGGIDPGNIKQEPFDELDIPSDPLATVASSIAELEATPTSNYVDGCIGLQIKEEPIDIVETEDHYIKQEVDSNPTDWAIGQPTQEPSVLVIQPQEGHDGTSDADAPQLETHDILDQAIKEEPIQLPNTDSAADLDDGSKTNTPNYKLSITEVSQRYNHGYNCPVCCKYVPTKSKLAIHMRCHNSTSLVTTGFGDAGMHSLPDIKPELSLDDTSMSIKTYVCQLCGARFDKSTQLNIHLRCHNSKGLVPTCIGDITDIPKFRTQYSKPTHISNILKRKEQEASGQVDESHGSLEESESLEKQDQELNVKSETNLTETSLDESDVLSPSAATLSHGTTDSNDPWVCVVCAKSFSTMSKLTIHQRCHNSKELPMVFRCNRCGKTSKSEEHLQAHLLDCRGSRTYECDLCPKAFRRAYNLWEHKQTHTGAKPFPCTVCGKAFAKQDSLNSHMTCHRDIRPYSCSECGATFKLVAQLSHHIKSHSLSHKHSCEVCDKTFTLPDDLTAHRLTHSNQKMPKSIEHGKELPCEMDRKRKLTHTDDEPSNECDLCGKRFKIAKNLAAHRKTHMSEDKCDQLGKRFLFGRELEAHKATHANFQQHMCNQCGKTFKQKADLQKHVKKHNVKPVHCSYCGEAFRQTETLAKHQAIHSGETPQTCIVCGKKFMWTGALIYHKHMHTGLKPFQCEYCEQTFAKSTLKTRHKQLHHKEHALNDCNLCHSKFKTPSDVDIHKMMAHAILNPVTDATPWVCSICNSSFTQSYYLHEHEQYHLDNRGQIDTDRSSDDSDDDHHVDDSDLTETSSDTSVDKNTDLAHTGSNNDHGNENGMRSHMYIKEEVDSDVDGKQDLPVYRDIKLEPSDV